MEGESFEDEEVAETLNKYFVAIKVDREERPDIDSIYMTVCQALTDSGGWPLTIIMTPDKKPFFAGTYFPKRSKYGRSGLIDVLLSINDAWGTKKQELIESSNQIINAIRSSESEFDRDKIGMETIHEAYNEFKYLFDTAYGGFGSSPKFPTSHNISFLLRYNEAFDKKDAVKIVEKTLESMYRGGIFDHIGFGFSRYSTDKMWLVPHFEKMLYDNALLATAYTEGYQVTSRELYKEIADSVFTYILRDMTSPEGGFYSAEDADSEGEEGKFYVWTVDEIKSVLGDDDGELYCMYYNITDKGNFEGKSIPNLIDADMESLESNHELKNKLNGLRERLFNYREKRVHPYKDDKILTSWNGLMIGAMAYGGRIFNNEKYITAAKNAADFILNSLVKDDGRLMARYREGQSAYLAYLDDYAFLVYGLVELYQATFESVYLKKALELNNDMIRLFWDSVQGGLFIYGSDSEELIARPKDIYDGAMPSGNSVAALNMLRLSRMTGNTELENKANKIFHTFGGSVKKSSNSYAFLLMALLYGKVSVKEIVIAGDKEDNRTRLMIDEINKKFIPFSTMILNDGDGTLYNMIPFIKDQKKINGRATVYICENFACGEPLTDAYKLTQKLENR